MTINELEWRLLYSVIVAGKSATFAENVMSRLYDNGCGDSPFDVIRELIQDNALEEKLKTIRSGNYKKISKCFRELTNAHMINLRRCTPQQLEAIHGIGPKTSRFFIMWTRPETESRFAALDTHVLKWINYLGYAAPKSTPSGQKYADLELIFLSECDKRGMTARAVDSMIWDFCSTKGHLSCDWPNELKKLE